ncbi:hypothetical protein FQN57_006039 [Myotisia sp. PD_48]|nr:hypothetical protein FQN57_006039 [Myotisia sp. PD_48]
MASEKIDDIMEKSFHRPPINPFSDSNTPSLRAISYASDTPSAIRAPPRRQFKSYRLNGEYERTWLDDKRLKKTRVGKYIIWGFVVAGLALSAYINFNVTQKVKRHEYCLILDDQFSTLDTKIWNHEVQINGFGTGSFDWTTSDEKNTYVDGEGLHIVPTLTTESTSITPEQLLNGYTLNLTESGGDGSCTGTTNSACSIRSNATTGTIIPPVRSARLNTKGTKSIRYGRVEVVAKMPKGDWMWPAIWMMPLNDSYGEWPASGEIDIAEGRGNDVDYPIGGRDTVLSTIHWGPTPMHNAYWKALRGKAQRRTDYTQKFHTFGLEWSENYMFTYINTPLHQVMYWDFRKDRTMWQQGDFDGITFNDSLVVDPWSQTGNPNTPFDQQFYLILNVAIGSRNGWFPDGIGGKPWTDAGLASADFHKSLDKFYPTWPEDSTRGMTIKSVKMWQQGACG